MLLKEEKLTKKMIQKKDQKH